MVESVWISLPIIPGCMAAVGVGVSVEVFSGLGDEEKRRR